MTADVYRIMHELAQKYPEYETLPGALQTYSAEVASEVLALDEQGVRDGIVVCDALQYAKGLQRKPLGEVFSELIRRPIASRGNTLEVRTANALWHMRNELAQEFTHMQLPWEFPEYRVDTTDNIRTIMYAALLARATLYGCQYQAMSWVENKAAA
jgi:hypothetical protein